MSLPNLPAGDKFRREVRTEWGGLNLNENAGDGELIEALNLSSREYPLIASARFVKHSANTTLVSPYAYSGMLGYLFNVGGDILLYDPTRPDATTHHTVRRGFSEPQYAVIGHRMCIFPSKQIYDFDTGDMSDMEESWTSTGMVYFQDGEIGGVPAEGNTIYAEGANWADHFRPGDAVSISGSGWEANNKTAIIREIDGDRLHFDENCFTVSHEWHRYLDEPLPGGQYYFTLDGGETYSGFITNSEIPAGVTLSLNAGTLSYISPPPNPMPHSIPVYVIVGAPTGTEFTLLPPADASNITISRTVPDLDYVCVNENRVWGCKGDTIYACKLGDPLNWNVFDGLSTDSWSVEAGTDGAFTGCCSFQGYPTFFKENAVFKVLGDEPKNFVLRRQNIAGVRAGAHKSIVEVRGRLYYLSGGGVMEWNGGDYPSIVSAAIGLEPRQIRGSAAGTDTVRYYIELLADRYEREVGLWVPQLGIYAYDTRFGTWHHIRKAPEQETLFAGDGAHNWMIKDWNDLMVPMVYELGAFPELPDTETEWAATFADSTRAYKTALTGSEGKKGILRLLIRCRLAGSMKVWIAYDGGEFEEAGTFGGEDGMAKGSRVVPLILRRCDYWQLRLTGTGDAVIYSIAVERYGGEWQQA